MNSFVYQLVVFGWFAVPSMLLFTAMLYSMNVSIQQNMLGTYVGIMATGIIFNGLVGLCIHNVARKFSPDKYKKVLLFFLPYSLLTLLGMTDFESVIGSGIFIIIGGVIGGGVAFLIHKAINRFLPIN